VDGLTDLIKHYKLGCEVKQLVDLVAEALVLDKPAEAEAPAPEAAAVEEKAEAAMLAGRKILVIDDEPDVCTFLSTMLEDHGAEVFTATDGDQGLDLVRKEKPDLVTLDLSMPGKDGGKVFEELRKDKEIADTKVCIVTGKPELRRLIYDRPVPPPEGYLNKPVTEESFLLNVRKILELAHEVK
jgi:CheY-like chemotaxis protein